jgi:hypothetical protein
MNTTGSPAIGVLVRDPTNSGEVLHQRIDAMSLLRSICCMFGGRCAEEEPKPTTETTRREAPGDLGQREAERERASEDQLRHMESGATSTPRQGPH